jgi:hypothetical protein
LIDKTLILIIGGQRSGSTLFHDFISSHPELSTLKSTFPEPKTFLKADINVNDYLNSFENPESNFLIEKSTSYHEFPAHLTQAKELFKKVIFFFIARNPVDRAISNYWFTQNAGFEKRPLEEALFSSNKLNYNTSVSPFSYIERGAYIAFVKQFEQYHPKDKLHFFVLEEMLSDSIKTSEELAKIIGLQDEFNHDILLDKVNSNRSYPKVSEPIKKKLILTFEPYNRLLFNWLNREIKIWS